MTLILGNESSQNVYGEVSVICSCERDSSGDILCTQYVQEVDDNRHHIEVDNNDINNKDNPAVIKYLGTNEK